MEAVASSSSTATSSSSSTSARADTTSTQTQASALIDRHRTLGVPDTRAIAAELGDVHARDPQAGAALQAEVEAALPAAEQQSLARDLAPVLAGVAAARSAGALAPPPVAGARYPSADAAVYNALERANPLSIRDNLEYGGLVVRDGTTGRYSATEPLRGTATGFDPSAISVPAGADVVGDYHTHGDYSLADTQGNAVRTSHPARDDFNSDGFSRQDLRGITADAAGKAEYRGYLGTPRGDYRSFDPAAQADAVMRTPLPNTLRAGGQGALIGGGIELAAGGVQALRDGSLDGAEAGHLVEAGARGATVGAAYAVTEQGLVRMVDRTAGSTVQRAATAVATHAGAAEAGALGAGTRVVASRLAGAGAAGAVLSAGLSVYDNRAGLANGDSQAIGNVAGDVVVGATAALGGAAAGAAIGSVVPVVGTAVGAVVGLGVGVAADYVMRAGGVDKAVANVVSGGVDAVKGAASRIASWFG